MKIFNIQSKGLRAALATAMAFCLLATCMLTNMIGVFTAGADVKNLIVNGDFESKDITGWINEWSNTASAVEGGHNGGYAMSLKCSGQYSSMVQKPTLKANTWYTLSFWTKRVSGDGAHAVWIKTNGNNWASDWFNKNGADWEQSTVTFNTGANTSFEFRFGADSGVNAVYYYDDITLVEENVKQDGGLLYDGGFESGKMITWNNISAHSEITTADKHTGNYSMLLKENANGWKATAQKVTLEKGADYILTFWAKAASTPAGTVYLWVNECETQSDGADPKVGNLDIELTNEWKQYTVKFTAHADHADHLVRFGLGSDPAVKAYIDDVKLIKEPNLIANGDFETGDMTSWNKNSCTASAVTTAHTGSYAMSVTGGKWAAVNQEVAVEKNSFYTITFWSKRISGTGNHVLWIKDSGNIAEVRYNSDEWKETSVSFFSGNNEKVDVRFGIDDNGAETTNLIDDVKMVKEDVAQDGGLLFDGGFEFGKMIAWNNVSAHSEFTTADKHTGDYSLLLKEDSGIWKATAQKIALKKNATYRITFWAKAASTPAGTVYLWVNECETKPDGADPKVGNLDIELTDAWKQYTTDFTTDATHTNYLVRFGLGDNTAVKAYIDDVKLEELKTSSDDGILLNYDFENGIADWTLFSATTNTSTAATTAHAGTGSMHLSGSQWSAIEQTTKTLKKNTYYNVSFWAKRDAGTGVAHLWVNGKGSDDKLDGFDIAIKPASGDGWVKYQKVVNTGNYDGLRVRFGIEDTASTFFIDDVKIEEIPSDGYIVNGGFEFGTAGWEVSNKMTATDSRDSQYGANALKINTTGQWVSLIQTVNVKKNTEYKVIFWSKTDGSSATKQTLYIKTAADKEITTKAFNDGVVTDYTKYEKTFNSGDNEKIKLCFVSVSDPAKYFLDSVSMFEFVEPSDDGFIKNGDFETGTLDPWQNLWNLSPSIVTDAVQGKYALKVDIGAGNAYSGMVTSFAVEKNTTYRVSYDVKVGSGNCVLYIKDGDTQLDSADMKGSSWNHVEKELNSGDHTKIDLRFCFSAKSDNAVYYLDNVKVEKVTQKDDGYVLNGDFESGKVSPWYAEWGNSTVSLITENTYEGNYAMKGTTTKQWAQVMQTINVKKNTDYILSYYSKEAVGDARLWIKGNGDGNNINEALLNTTSDWKQTVVEFNSGNFDKVDIRYGVNDAAGGSYCIDDVYVREKGAELFDGVVYNGDFEKDMTHWTNEWAHSEITTEAVHGGSKALLLKQNDTAWQATMQKIKLEPNTQYMLRFYAKAKTGSQMYLWMNSTDGTDTKVVDRSLNPGADWTLYEIDFNSGKYTELKLRFGLGDGGNASAQIYIDDVSVKKYVKPVVKARPLTSFGVAANCPKDDSVNLIKNGGFEATTDAQWASLIGKDGLSIVGAPKGSGASNVHTGASALLFDTTGAKSNIRTYFKVKVEKNTEYVFSAWMKGPFLSADNHGLNTIGLADPTTGKFLVLTKSGWQQGHSTENKQLVPPAWDNEWHLRSVSFNSGDTTEVAIAFYGIGSKLYVDDIALYKSDDGMMYSDARMTSVVKTSFDFEQTNCESKDNLVKNGDFSDGAKEWEDGLGATNEFVSIRESEYEYGDSLHYKASNNPVGISYIKWIDVEPNTNYIFSADVRILESGRGYIGLIDDRYTSPRTVYASEFDTETYGEDWFKTAIKFNTSVFTRIGIIVSDQGGEALIDNVRLFKAENAADVEDKFIPLPDEPDQPDNPDKPDGPKTGDPMALVVAAIAIALAAVMTTVFFRKARRA